MPEIKAGSEKLISSYTFQSSVKNWDKQGKVEFYNFENLEIFQS